MRAAIASASCALLLVGCGAAQERSAPDPPAALARVGAQVDVSNEAGRQREVSIAVDPSDGAVLLAGSNSRPGSTMRTYASTDGGARWTSAALPVPPASTSDGCAADPAVGIDRAGRQYFAFGWISPCTFFGRASIFVATRADAHAPWLTPAAPVAPHDTNAFDDKPALAIDNSPQSRHPNRVYVAWTRDGGRAGDLILVSHSDDGVNWSTPVRANHTFSQGLSYASLA